MLETAMLKVWSTEALWNIVNDTVQIYGGKAFFTDEPFERMLRDARLNQIGEGANDVLRAFIAMVGIRGVGEQLLKVKDAVTSPLKGIGTLLGFGGEQVKSWLTTPDVPVRSPELREFAKALSHRVKDFGQTVQSTLIKHRKDPDAFLFRQYIQERIADAGCELYASSCALSRLDSILAGANGDRNALAADVAAGKHFLKLSDRRIRQCLAALTDNDDADITATADAVLARG
jgi:hypothetical protein